MSYAVLYDPEIKTKTLVVLNTNYNWDDWNEYIKFNSRKQEVLLCGCFDNMMIHTYGNANEK